MLITYYYFTIFIVIKIFQFFIYCDLYLLNGNLKKILESRSGGMEAEGLLRGILADGQGGGWFGYIDFSGIRGQAGNIGGRFC